MQSNSRRGALRDRRRPKYEEISSVGLGVLWNPSDALSMSLFWGDAQNRIQRVTKDDLQDDGVHFRLDYRF